MKLSALKQKQWSAGKPQQQNQTDPEMTVMKKGRLSPSEIEVLKWVAKGLTAHEVASKLFRSLDTIETHKKNIVKKLEARNTVDAVVKAVRMRLI